MLLQPLVENSIKHGCRRRSATGRITHPQPPRANGHAIIEVVDDGARHLATSGCSSAMSSGIGLQNVNERLRVIYGANYQLAARQRSPGEGTVRALEIPELAGGAASRPAP